jgi:hypothetical protein
MLQKFLRIHDIDTLLTQEVRKMIMQDLFGYDIHYNSGKSRLEKAIVAMDGIRLENIRLPSGRAMEARFRDT